jgi:hypothetical protein
MTFPCAHHDGLMTDPLFASVIRRSPQRYVSSGLLRVLLVPEQTWRRGRYCTYARSTYPVTPLGSRTSLQVDPRPMTRTAVPI